MWYKTAYTRTFKAQFPFMQNPFNGGISTLGLAGKVRNAREPGLHKKWQTPFFVFIFLSGCLLLNNSIPAQSVKEASKNYCTIENYYKIKWGQAESFISLWKKNHYPLLKKAAEKGDIISITAEKPLLHSGEDTRWDFRVIIVFKTTELAFDPDLIKPYRKELYPDLEKLEKEEQSRFELLIAHWDILTGKIPL